MIIFKKLKLKKKKKKIQYWKKLKMMNDRSAKSTDERIIEPESYDAYKKMNKK
jgi:hypothetical protein